MITMRTFLLTLLAVAAVVTLAETVTAKSPILKKRDDYVITQQPYELSD
jgi:hypothetical protein